MDHEVVAAPAAPGGRSAGTLTILVDITWPEGAIREQRLQRQEDLARRLAAVGDVDPASPEYATGLHIPGKEEVDPANLSATNTAYNNCVVQLGDGTTTTIASRNGRANYSGEQKGREKNTKELKDKGGKTGGKTGGAAFGTGANQAGSAPSDGAAAKIRRPIPGQLNPVRAHGFCFGFGANGVGLPQKLHDKFAGENGFGDGPITEGGCGPITEGGCEIPNFSEAGVTKGKSTWQLDEHDNLILPVHSSIETEGHPSCQIGGCVPVEKVDESWRVCHWALKYILTRRIVLKVTQNQRNNGAGEKSRAKRGKE